MQVINILLILSCMMASPDTTVSGFRVLAVLPVFARSHHKFFQGVLGSLAKAGHQVTVYSPFPHPAPPPNYTDIHMDNVVVDENLRMQGFLEWKESPQIKCMDNITEAGVLMFQNFVENERIQSLLKSREKFDVILTETLGAEEFTAILGFVFNAPVIGMQACATTPMVNSILGNELAFSYIPNICTSFSDKMTFFERVTSFLYSTRLLYYTYYRVLLPTLEVEMRKHFPSMPPLLDMVNNISLMFVNDHLTVDYIRSRTPNIIPVGGIHIGHTTPLPQDLQEFMDGASDGVILFSLGTLFPDELQHESYFNMFINVFRQLPQRVVWKSRKNDMQGLPDSVTVHKWVPQESILGFFQAHLKCVLFITHGGLLSQHEAITHGVPVVGFPQFFDQHRNVRLYLERGVGVSLDTHNLSEDNIKTAILTVTNNSQYRENMRRLSAKFKDLPMTPAETVVFWTEYVVRHQGAVHLKPASKDLSWYQLALLDVLAVILLSGGGITFALFWLNNVSWDVIKYLVKR